VKKQPRVSRREYTGDEMRGGAEKRKKLRVELKHWKLELPVARARVSRAGD